MKTTERRHEQFSHMLLSKCFSTALEHSTALHHTMQNFVCETRGDDTKNKTLPDDVLELFMDSNKLGGTLCGLLYMSLSLNPRAARSGIIEECDTCLIVFLHNATDPMERVCAGVGASV